MKKKISCLFLSFAAILLLLGGCTPTANQQNGNEDAELEEELEFVVSRVGLTYVKSPLNVPSIVEKEKEFYQEAFNPYNLLVTYHELTTGPEQTQALASSDVHILYAVGATSVILSAANDADIKILSIYSRSPEAFRIFTATDDITSAADLAGKKVAGPKGTILHELLIAYLATGGLTQDDVDFIQMDISDAMVALDAGEVDCALLAGPSAYYMEKDGFHVLTTGEGLVEAVIVTATTEKFVAENRILVDTFLEAQQRLHDYMAANEQEILALTAAETGLETDAVEEMYLMYDFDTEIREQDIESIKQTEQFLRDNGMIEKAVDIDSLIITLD